MRLLRSFAVALLAIILIVTTVFAAWEFMFPSYVEETGDESRTDYPVLLGYGGQSMVGAGYIAATALDTNMQIGTTSVLYMVAADEVASVVPNLPSGGIATLSLYTGYTPNQTNFPIIDGDDGYAGIPDAAALEPANNFEFEFEAYVNAIYTTPTLLMYKEGAYALGITSDNNLTSAILNAAGWRENIGGVGNFDTIYGDTWAAQTFVAGATEWIEFLNLWCSAAGAPTGDVYVSIRATAAGVPTDTDITMGTLDISTVGGVGAWHNIEFTPIRLTNGVTYAVVVGYPDGDAVGNFEWHRDAVATHHTSYDSGESWPATAAGTYRAEIWGSTEQNSVTLGGVTSDEHTVTASATGGGTNLLILTVDAGSNSVALAGATVLNNANYWELGRGNGMPYWDSYTHEVAGAPIVWYEPNTMILGDDYSTGTATFTNGSTLVTGAGTTWTELMEGGLIINTADDVPCEVDEVYNATNLAITAAYGGAGGAGLTYFIAPLIPDRQGAVQDGYIVWGVNDGITVTYGEMESFEDTEVEISPTTSFTQPTSTMPSTWFAEGSNLANLPFYDSFLDVSNQTGQPVQTIYFLALIGLAFGVFFLFTVNTRMALLGVIGFNIVLFIGSSMTIVPMWIPFAVLVVQLGIMYLYRQVSY